MDRLQSMRAFAQVVEQGGFSAAARKLDIAPAAVTRLIGDLEEHLGARLLQRTTRRVALTRAGEVYLSRLRAALAEISEAEAEVQAEVQVISGTLQLLAEAEIAAHLLAPAVAAFQRLHPAVAVEIHVWGDMLPSINDFDLAVLHFGVPIGQEFVSRAILHSEAVLCASPDYLRQHGRPEVPEDLVHHRMLQLREPGRPQGRWELLDPHGVNGAVEKEVVPVIVANHSDTLLHATLDGAGISSQPLELVEPWFQAGRLCRVLAPWITARLAIRAILPSRKFIPCRTRAFLDHLVQHSRQLASH